MAKTIDPAFQAAPVLGGTSYNPIEFARRHNIEKFQIQKKQLEEQERNTAKGLDNLMVDLKGWEDQAGFKEIMGDQQKVLDGFLELSRKGLNLVSPKNTQEIMAYKAINDAHQQIIQKVDTWQRNKTAVDVINAAIKEDQKLPVEQRKIDENTTRANLTNQLKGGIVGRNLEYDKVVAFNPTMGNVEKYVKDHESFIPKVLMDPVTGKPNPTQEKEQIKYMGDLFDAMKEPERRALKELQARTPQYQVAPLKDVFLDLFSPAAAGKLTKYTKPAEDKSKSSSNFLGSQAKITPGTHEVNDLQYGGRNYNDRYDFTSNKTFFIPPGGGEYSTDTGWESIPTAGGPVEGNLLFYDPHTDALIFKVSQDARYPWIKNNTTISIPRKNLAKSDELPIELSNGKQGKLKDILPAAEAENAKVKTIGGKDFRVTTPYIPKSKGGKYDNL